MTIRIYVGCKSTERHVFKFGQEPTVESHGWLYNAVIGPFRTMRAAKLACQPGQLNNPHMRCVGDYEREATQQYRWSRLA